ncbi:protein kinase domain-containing protein [Nocardioides sp. CPCC 205120]|uniref:serine/threonine-protein kinase n=1 Tax=Nocardioides sp. CPCC 205120 TaxID=3406462 RepID=UPI003B50E7BA
MAKFPEVGDQFGSYRVTGQIGQGGMGVVYAAEQTGLGRTVALKVLAPQYAAQGDYQERFVREASVLARLDSVHIIHIYDHGEQDGCLYIATQYVTGGDLGQAIKQGEGMPVREAAEIVAQTAGGLHDAHKAGVIHRDVKPSNVLLRDRSDDLHAYLCDFGIAQGGQPGLTVAGSVAGTMGYMAPERCRGEAATPASDIYALGCVLWTALAGRPPYQGTDVEVGLAHLSEPVPQFVEGDPMARIINAVLRRSMAKDPAARYPDAASMRRDLRTVVDRARTQPELRLVPDLGEPTLPGAPAVRPAGRIPGPAGGAPSRGSSPSGPGLGRPTGTTGPVGRTGAPGAPGSGGTGGTGGSRPAAGLPPRPGGPAAPGGAAGTPYRGDAASRGSSAGHPAHRGPVPGSSPSNPAHRATPQGTGSGARPLPQRPAAPSSGSNPSIRPPAGRPGGPGAPGPRPAPPRPAGPTGPAARKGASRPSGSTGTSGPSVQAIAAVAIAAIAVVVLLVVLLTAG